MTQANRTSRALLDIRSFIRAYCNKAISKRAPVIVGASLLLAGCTREQFPILNPIGKVGVAEYNLLLLSVAIMTVIVVPVIIGTLWIAWTYRATGSHSGYDPEFDESKSLDFVTVFVPLLTILALGAATWIYTHRLDPYQPLGKNEKPYEIQAVSLDYKWLFIYPNEQIATVGEMVAPIDRPVTVRITSDPMMTSIFIPGLVSQIYAMPGMETRANFLVHTPAVRDGSNAMYSGPGFAHQRFVTRLVSADDFKSWTSSVKSGAQVSWGKDGKLGRPSGASSPPAKLSGRLDLTKFKELHKRSDGYPLTYFNDVQPDLFAKVVQKYMPNYRPNPLPTAIEYRQGQSPRSSGDEASVGSRH